jgi:hypothetical protein
MLAGPFVAGRFYYCQEDTFMTPNEVRAAARHLTELHQQFAPLFGYQPAQAHALTYLRGLLLQEGRKNTEAIALNFNAGQVRPLQEFIAGSPWDYRPVQQEIQSVFAQTLVPSTAQWNIGTVGVIDEYGEGSVRLAGLR